MTLHADNYSLMFNPQAEYEDEPRTLFIASVAEILVRSSAYIQLQTSSSSAREVHGTRRGSCMGTQARTRKEGRGACGKSVHRRKRKLQESQSLPGRSSTSILEMHSQCKMMFIPLSDM